MKSVSGREFARIIERLGWSLLRISVRLSVPIHGSKPLKAGLLRHRMKLADLLDDDLS